MAKKTRIVLYPYDMKSEGYALLRDRLRKEFGEDNVVGVYSEGKYQPKADDFIIGWGFSKAPIWKQKAEKVGATWLNLPSAIGDAVNKEVSFSLFSVNGVKTPEFTSSAHLASAWVSKEIDVVQRTKITSSKGKGASVAHCAQEFDPHAKLYTKLIPKTREFRVHVFKGKVIDVHEKIFLGKDPKNFEIMCAATPEQDAAWEWKRTGVAIPELAIAESVGAVKAVGLDFGGVDVVTDKKGVAYVLEVNSAPWLGTINAGRYVAAILKEVA